MSKEEELYLGKAYDLKSARVLDRPTLYNPDDLTTHGVVVGMTGSGKTGLCVDILEEAALKGIPALMVDPKGDIANLLLHFPDLSPESFFAARTFACSDSRRGRPPRRPRARAAASPALVRS